MCIGWLVQHPNPNLILRPHLHFCSIATMPAASLRPSSINSFDLLRQLQHPHRSGTVLVDLGYKSVISTSRSIPSRSVLSVRSILTSGGPLLDSKGNMIGINTAIFTQTGTSAGVGFAIPSSTVLKTVPQLIQYGKVVRAGLNVEIASDLIANQLNVRNGILVLQVAGNSFAAKAGLLPTTRGFAGNIVLGDIVIAIDGKPIRNKAELYKVLDDYNIGDKVVLKIQRGGQNLELPLTLEEASF